MLHVTVSEANIPNYVQYVLSQLGQDINCWSEPRLAQHFFLKYGSNFDINIKVSFLSLFFLHDYVLPKVKRKKQTNI